MKIFSKAGLAAALGLAFSAASYAAPLTLTIDADGGGAGGSVASTGLDWNPSSALVQATNQNVFGIPSTGNAAQPNIGDVVQTYTHAKLTSFLTTEGGVSLAELGGSGEWTFVAGFREYVSDFGGTLGGDELAELTTIAGGENFFRIYYSPTNSSTLTGQGHNDGILVLEGIVLEGGVTTFTQDVAAGTDELLDQSGTDNYGGLKTVVGTGSGAFDIQVTDFDSNFIKGLLAGDVFSLNFTSQLDLPFDTANPSSCYTGADNVTDISGPGLATLNGQQVGCAGNTIGSINGETGPNLLLRTDSSTAFSREVPEPGTLALAGLALGGLALARRRKA